MGSKRSDEGSKWLKHYCSDHQILLVGEGDFSFTLCLAKAFASATNIVASSLDTHDDVIKKYRNAKSNIDELKKLGACILHGVDATKMKSHSHLNMNSFDRVIFNFPHAGFHGKREHNLSLIKMHKDLVGGFFKNASSMIRVNGEIHVNHKTTHPYTKWNIEKLAEESFLKLMECTDFKKEDYPGYYNKRGDGNKCDKSFPLGRCSTFKFIHPRRTNGIAPSVSHCARNEVQHKEQQVSGGRSSRNCFDRRRLITLRGAKLKCLGEEV
ncbi:heavy metal-associated isoprenylated plant protein 41-like [Vicia villosa]|uniref:heavy metal-associated isoprenylated plant protein 41-like n=1 Tax=Vicia villosa TaxID=3911 RepID=UPI00273C644D|nr:heavy metal-associated isoprenylated plant protein 41-like [Vicia villosa]